MPITDEPVKLICPRCEGCGQIANDDEGTPWSQWLDMSLRSAAAILMGLVHPIPCPDCGGAGVVQVTPALLRVIRDMARALSVYTDREQWFQSIHYQDETTSAPGLPVKVWSWIDQRTPWEIGIPALREAHALGLLADEEGE